MEAEVARISPIYATPSSTYVAGGAKFPCLCRVVQYSLDYCDARASEICLVYDPTCLSAGAPQDNAADLHGYLQWYVHVNLSHIDGLTHSEPVSLTRDRVLPPFEVLEYLSASLSCIEELYESVPPLVPNTLSALLGESQPALKALDFSIFCGIPGYDGAQSASGDRVLVAPGLEWETLDAILTDKSRFPKLEAVRIHYNSRAHGRALFAEMMAMSHFVTNPGWCWVPPRVASIYLYVDFRSCICVQTP